MINVLIYVQSFYLVNNRNARTKVIVPGLYDRRNSEFYDLLFKYGKKELINAREKGELTWNESEGLAGILDECSFIA